jgi:hypothetical protein
MNVSPTAPKMNAGTCPHGNPIGSCPICAGLTGGGGGFANNKSRGAGEWSYDKCYSVWQQMLKNKAMLENFKKQQKLETEKQNLNVKTFADKVFEKINTLNVQSINIQNNSSINKLVNISNKTVLFLYDTAKSLTNFVKNSFTFVYQRVVDISDKLTAIYGELKLKIEKFLNSKTNLKQKLKSIFEIFTPLEIDNEDKDVDEETMFYKLKTTISEIKEKLNKKYEEVVNDKAD